MKILLWFLLILALITCNFQKFLAKNELDTDVDIDANPSVQDTDVRQKEQLAAIEEYLKSTYAYLYPDEDHSTITNYLSISPEFFTTGSAINAKGPFHKVTAGQSNRFVLGLKNYWIEPLYVIGVSGFITTPDFGRAVRNLTIQRQWGTVANGETISSIMEFVPDFEAPSVGLILLVDFTDRFRENVYHAIAYKEVIEIISAPDSAYDSQALLLYTIFAGFLICSLFLVKRKLSQKSTHQKQK